MPFRTSIEGRISTTRRGIEELQQYVKPLVAAVEEREYWSKALADLNSRLPAEYIWITSFEPPSKDELKKVAAPDTAAGPGGRNRPGAKDAVPPPVRVMIRGIYLSRDAGNNAGPSVVDEFAAKLQESPYFEPVLKPEEGFEREADDIATAKWGFRWAIPLNLKNPIDLK